MKYPYSVALSLGIILLVSFLGDPTACLGYGGGDVCDQGVDALATVVLCAQIVAGGLVIFLVGRGALKTALRTAGPDAPSDDILVDDESKRAAGMAIDAAAPDLNDFMVMNGLRESLARPADNSPGPADKRMSTAGRNTVNA